MSLTRHLRPFLAGSRRGPASVLLMMVLTFAVVSVHVLCAVHLDEHAQAGGHVHAGEAYAHGSAAHSPGAEVHGEGTDGCGDHGASSAQCDPLRPSPLVHVLAPERSVQRLAQTVVHDRHRTAASVAPAAAPSLHALGISRT